MSRPDLVVSRAADRDIAVAAVALEYDCYKLRQEECPGEYVYDVAVTVADTAHSLGMDWDTIARRPWEAVKKTREIWKELDKSEPTVEGA